AAWKTAGLRGLHLTARRQVTARAVRAGRGRDRESVQLAGLRQCAGLRVGPDGREDRANSRQPFFPSTNKGVEPTLGFEQRTCCLRNSCSTAELCRRRSRIADAERHQLFVFVQTRSTSGSKPWHIA